MIGGRIYYLLTLDVVPEVSYDGIRQINAVDWLLWECRM